MEKVIKLVNYLRDPHTKKVQHYKGRYQELDELSNVAVEIGDEMAYKSLQSEMREVFFDYSTAIVVDSMYKLVPHVLIIWVISLVFPIVSIPIVNWKVNILGFYLLVYLIFHIGKLLAKPIRGALSKINIFSFVRATNKI